MTIPTANSALEFLEVCAGVSLRAFNEMCRELRIKPDYTDYSFTYWWNWRG